MCNLYRGHLLHALSNFGHFCLMQAEKYADSGFWDWDSEIFLDGKVANLVLIEIVEPVVLLY